MKNKYELLLILPGTLDDKEVETRSNEVLELVKEHGEDAELISMGKNRLAYPIKQIRYGYFYTIVFTATPEKVTVLQNKIRLMREVLRGIISHFNATLTMQQRTAYTTQSMPAEMSEEKAAPEAMEEKVKALVDNDTQEATATQPVASTAARDLEKLDIAAINKKLDDLMQGDVIPGV